jgi:hypothetical protein
MGLLDQHVDGADFRAQEELLQARSLSDDVAKLREASVAAGRERLRTVSSRAAGTN